MTMVPNRGDLVPNAGGADTRRSLTANTTLYVRTDGSDANNGSADSPGSAFRSFQAAYNYAAASFDLAGFTITLQAGNEGAARTFPGITFAGPWTGGGAINVGGRGAALTTFNDQGAFGDAFTITCLLPGVLSIDNATLTSSQGDCIDHSGLGIVHVGGGISFGAAPGGFHIDAFQTGAIVDTGSSYAISGAAISHVVAQNGGFVSDDVLYTGPFTITVTGTPAFSSAFAAARQNGTAYYVQTTFSGAATGTRATCADGGTLIVPTGGGGLTFFPGSNPTSVNAGGIYDAGGGSRYQGLTNTGVVGANNSWALDTGGDEILAAGSQRGWSAAGTIDWSNSFETGWVRDGAYQIGQRSGTNAQKYSLYGSFTNASNYERLSLDAEQATAGVHRIRSEAAGSGTLRVIAVDTFVKSGLPAAADIPAGTWGVFKDSSGGGVYLAANDGGTIKKVQLT